MRLKLIVAYEGTDFAGFQRQSEDKGRTVQGALEAAVSRLSGQWTQVQGAGRTDQGVHALGQVVSFETSSELSPIRWPMALNAHLPPDLRVLSTELAAPDFDPRRQAVAKTYRYLVDTAAAPRPIYRRFSLHLAPALDLEAMRASARVLVGDHDFRSFSGRQHLDAHRRMMQVRVTELVDQLLTIEMTASGFLYHMARNIAGTLLEVGLGKRQPGDMAAILAGADRGLAGHTAKAKGLTLLQVYYSPPAFLDTDPDPG